MISQPMEINKESIEVARSKPRFNQIGFGTNTKAVDNAQQPTNAFLEKNSIVDDSRESKLFRQINIGINKIE
jgi:hypothetical protein